MADIELPADIGRVRHLTAQMHKSEDDAGDPIPEDYLLAADGARGHKWVDPLPFGGAGPDDTAAWIPLSDGAGGVIYDAGTGQIIVAFTPI
jgi:hypothetical protein